MALTMMSPPFSRCVLFPVDLRYGWDLRSQEHQKLLLEVDRIFKPQVTTMEFRCKYWSRAGNRRNPEDTKRYRAAESSMLVFGSNHICMLHKENRGWLVENPNGSATFQHSPLDVTDDLPYNFDSAITKEDCCKTTCMCAFSPLPDGERSLKRTRLKGDFKLHHCIKSCSCRYGHVTLQGADPATHQNYTALAALCHHRFCVALCKDMEISFSHRIFATNPAEALKELEPPMPPAELLNKVDASSIQIRTGNGRSLLMEDAKLMQYIKAHIVLQLDDHSKAYGSAEPATTVLARDGSTSDAISQAVMDQVSHLFVARFVCFAVRTRTLPNFDVLRSETGSSGSNNAQHHRDLLLIHGSISTGVFEAIINTSWKSSPQPDVEQSDALLMFVGCLTDEGEKAAPHANTKRRHRLTKKQPMLTPPPGLSPEVPESSARCGVFQRQPSLDPGLQEGVAEGEDIRVDGKKLKVFSPSIDLHDLPKKLIGATHEEKKRLLTGLHERMLHAQPADMLRLLQAMLLPKDIVTLGVKIAADCPECNKWKPRMHKMTLKTHLASGFNEFVLQDLFFLFDEAFTLMIDERIRWKTGDHLPNKLTPTILRSLVYLWLRIWGPMENLVTDQEGGLMSAEANAFFDNFEIKRIVVGTEGATTKGLVERHIQITKLSMLRFKKASSEQGLDLNYSDLCQECCMMQNHLLEYAGGTPQVALVGAQRGVNNVDWQTIDSVTGALQTRADIAETMIRGRAIAKQAILQSIMDERLTTARKMAQHKHGMELLVPGTAVDVWRTPSRKDQHGWHGPAELISIKRHAGSAICDVQGGPLLVPLRNIRKHALTSLFAYFQQQDPNYISRQFWVNPIMARATADVYYQEDFFNIKSDVRTPKALQLMELISQQPPGIFSHRSEVH